MQITETTINNSAKRSQFTSSKFKTILLVCLISFTTLLVRQTLQIQHSCNPMVHWSGELPAECQVAVNDDLDNFDDFSSTTQISKADFDDFSYSEKPIVNDNFDDSKDFDIQTKQPNIAQNTVKPTQEEVLNNPKAIEPEITSNIAQSESEKSNSIGQFVNEHSDDIVGGIAGVAGGVGAVAAASATAAFSIPVAGAVAIGMGIWFLIRSAL